MSKNFDIFELKIDQTDLKNIDKHSRNQIAGLMHAHNELTVLNRFMMFSVKETGQGELHDSAFTVQMWSILQLLAGKLFETWKMVCDRFMKSVPKSGILLNLDVEHKKSLDYLTDYFGERAEKSNALKFIRDKTAFHYDKLDLGGATQNLEEAESVIYLAQHPANCLYYLGSVLVFRTTFAMIYDNSKPQNNLSHKERTKAGANIANDDAKTVNFHLHVLLYGLISGLLEKALKKPLEKYSQVRIPVRDAPDPDTVGLPLFIDIGNHN